MTLQHLVVRNPKSYESVDLWTFDLLEVGHTLPCNNIRTFCTTSAQVDRPWYPLLGDV
jgi:hypothetical protein